MSISFFQLRAIVGRAAPMVLSALRSRCISVLFECEGLATVDEHEPHVKRCYCSWHSFIFGFAVIHALDSGVALQRFSQHVRPGHLQGVAWQQVVGVYYRGREQKFVFADRKGE